MTFREIDEAILNLVDPETGEILDYGAFESLQMEKQDKAEGMALWTFDLKDEVEQLKKEIDRLKARKDAAERKIESLKNYLALVLNGEKLKTPRVTVSYRNNESVDLVDEQAVIQWAEERNNADEVLKYKEPEISRMAIKKLIAEGVKVPGATLITKTSTIIR